MDSPRDDMQSLPEGIEALRALVLTMMSERAATLAERDAAVTERDTLLAQNDRLRHLLLQLRRMHFGPLWLPKISSGLAQMPESATLALG